jgi:hypothetical protein
VRPAPIGAAPASTLGPVLGAALIALATAWVGLAAFSTDGEAARGKGGKKGPLRLGLVDPAFSSSDAGTRALWLDRAADAGADTVRLLANWRGITRTGPQAPADPTIPSDPSYHFEALDAAVRDAAARGFRILITINRAPDFAEGPDRDPNAETGTWKPSPERLAEFSTAIATRYSGSFPDPGNPGAVLPRVALWEIWGEPNLFVHLYPQTVDGKLFAPTHLRAMVNAASAAIKGVNRSNEIIAGATAPFGDHPNPIDRIAPLTFWRAFFCLRGRNLKPTRGCQGGKARIDAFSHNPLAGLATNEFLLQTMGPRDKAPHATDILIPDMHKLFDVLQAAREHKTVKPRKGTELWVSELLWETNPPDSGPKGVSLETQATYLAQSVRSLRKQGVSQILWVRIRDDAPDGDFASTLQSGLYFNDGTPKPALETFRAAAS